MTADQRNSFRFYGGIFVLVCAILMIIVRITGWMYYEEKLQLGVAVVFLCLGTILMATSRHRSAGENDKTA